MNRAGRIEREDLAGICEDLEPGAARSRASFRVVVLILVPLVILGIVAVIAIEGGPAAKDVAWVFTNPAILCAMIGGGVVPFIVAHKQRMQRVREVLLHHRRCPHCGYDLRELPSDSDDHCTVCPECACAWRLDEHRDAPSRPRVAGQTSGRRAWMWVALIIGTAMCAAGLVAYLLVR